MRKKVKKRETKNIYITTMKNTKYKMKLIFVIAFITASIIYI